MNVIEEGIVTDLREDGMGFRKSSAIMNILVPIISNPFTKLTSLREEHPLNAKSPIQIILINNVLLIIAIWL